MSKQTWYATVHNAVVRWLQLLVVRLSLYGPMAIVGVYHYRYDPDAELCSRNVKFCGVDFQVYYKRPDTQRRGERRRNHEAAVRVNARLKAGSR